MMKLIVGILALLFSDHIEARDCSPLLDFDVRTLNENTLVNLCDTYQGKVILVVNTASRCAFTDQYAALEDLYRQYRQHGLVVLGFPSNDFGQQEPGSEAEVKSFCRLTYGVQFPMFAKTHVAQRNADPFYRALGDTSGSYPRWNFHKYLIDRHGRLVTSYPSAIDPLHPSVIREIDQQVYRF